MKGISLATAAVVVCAGSAIAQPDGIGIPGAGMTQLAIQDTPTGFGNSTAGTQASPGGSEVDGLWGSISATTLNVAITGNLEGNFNKLWIFFDGVAGGENVALGDNVDGGFGEINNFAGMTWDSGFTPDHGIRVEVGGSFLGIRQFDLIDNTGGDIWTAGGTASLPLVNAAGGFGVTTGWDNANAVGVSDVSAAGALSATTGWEFSIDLATFFGATPSAVGIAAFVSNGGGDFLSNQVLPGIGGGGNLAGPATLDFNQIPGNQFAVIPTPGTLALLGFSGLVTRRRRR